jgi:MFS family permease
MSLLSSSAIMSIAAATLADIYEPHERGAKMGIYYAAPLLGTSMGPFLGGVFTQTIGWRAVFWFTLISGGIVLVSLFIFFKDSFRKERSLSYHNVLRRRTEDHQPVVKSQQMLSQKTIEGLEAGTTTPGDLHAINDITLSFTDVNPFPPISLVLKRWNNNAILLASGRFTTERSLSTSRVLILCQA